MRLKRYRVKLTADKWERKKTSKLEDIESVQTESEAIESIQSETQRENTNDRVVRIGLIEKMTFKQKFEEGNDIDYQFDLRILWLQILYTLHYSMLPIVTHEIWRLGKVNGKVKCPKFLYISVSQIQMKLPW